MRSSPAHRYPAAPRRPLLLAACALAFLLVPPAGQAQGSYPEKPVRIVAGFPPGGSADLLARLLGRHLESRYKQPFVVENRAGAGGTIGAANVAKSAPDGHALLLGLTASQTIAPAIYPDLPYDSAKDFAPVSLAATIPVALVVHPSLNVDSTAALIELARRSAAPLSFASSGNGAIPHLTGELFKHSQAISLEHIAYKGAPAAMTDLLTGRVPIMFDHLPSVLPHIKAGKLKVLGIAGSQRAAALPEIPTLAEQGIKGVEVRSWFGVLAPAKTPSAVVQSLDESIKAILEIPQVRTQLAEMGAEPSYLDAATFGRLIQEDTAMWGGIVKRTQAAAN